MIRTAVVARNLARIVGTVANRSPGKWHKGVRRSLRNERGLFVRVKRSGLRGNETATRARELAIFGAVKTSEKHVDTLNGLWDAQNMLLECAWSAFIGVARYTPSGESFHNQWW